MEKDKAPKESGFKKALLFSPIVLSVVFAVVFGFALKSHIHKMNSCTGTIVGTVTNYTSSTTYKKGRTHSKASADIVVKGDGVFPSQTIHTTSLYYAKQKEVTILYDPNDPDTYFFEGEQKDSLTLVILFAVLSAGEAAFAWFLFKYRENPKQDMQTGKNGTRKI